MLAKHTTKRLRHAAIVCLLALATYWIFANQSIGLLREANERLGDVVWQIGATDAPEERIILIDIDDRSIAEIGPWPWPRSQIAQLFSTLASSGVSQQILDIVFTEARSPEEDAPFTAAIQQHRPVLAQVFALNSATEDPTPASPKPPQAGEVSGSLDWPGCPAPFSTAQGFLANHATFANLGHPPTGYTGHISPDLSHDGIIRHQPAIICWGHKAYPALALAAGMRNTSESRLRLRRGGWLDAPWQLEDTQQMLPPMPLDNQGSLRIGWQRKPSSFISISASDILKDRVPHKGLAGAWVIIGSSAFGLNDSIATPFGPTAAGLLAHAQILTSWIDGKTPFTVRAAPAIQTTFVLIGLALLALISLRRPRTSTNQLQPPEPTTRWVLWLPAIGLLYGLGLMLLFAITLLQVNIWINPIEPALTVLIASTVFAGVEHLRMRLDRQRLFNHLSSYLPAPVAAALAQQAPTGDITAQLRPVTVCFADIRNFSAYCETRPPREAAAILHAFFSASTRVVEAHGGVIEAFQGDAVLAVWNADTPSPHPTHGNTSALQKPSHPAQALSAAKNLLDLSSQFLPDPPPEGLEPLQLGIGLETGLATVGSFGPSRRRTHMVMGRTVTIANRLVAMTGDLAHPILIGEGLATQLNGQIELNSTTVPLESLGTFLLEGLRVPHHVYAVPLHILTAHQRHTTEPTASPS